MSERVPTIIPTLRYEDAATAIDWLCDAFGFERHRVVPGENGTIADAQLTLGNGMIMLGTHSEEHFGRHQKIVGVPQEAVWSPAHQCI